MQGDAGNDQIQDQRCRGRNIVLCFDGTGDWIGSGKTNVAKIYGALEQSDDQLCFYDGGIGTLSNPQALSMASRTFLRALDLGVATSLRDKVLRGYQFLIENYREGDRIYMFGFSRGAYTARVLGGLIKNFGLLKPENDHIADYVWQTMAAVGDISEFKETAGRISRLFSRQGVEIEFMGLFDTVSSVGVIGRFNTYPNTDRNDIVKRVCHAVAIDEQRNVFPEALMHPQQPGLTEVWFPGVHRDVGGGLRPYQSRVADEALYWIAREAEKACLRVRFADTSSAGATAITPPEKTVRPRLNLPSFDPYVVVGLYPMKMFNKRVSDYRLLWPNFRHSRVVPKEAKVHSVLNDLLKDDDRYRPGNVPVSDSGAFDIEVFDPAVAERKAEQKGKPYDLGKTQINIPDFAGIVLGSTILLLLWNEASRLLLKSPIGVFGPSWPEPVPDWPTWLVSAWHPWLLVAIAFLVFLLGQARGISPLTSEKKRTVLLDTTLPALGLLIMIGILAATGGTPVLLAGIAAGATFVAVSFIGKWPALRADNVLASLLLTGTTSLVWLKLYLLFDPEPFMFPFVAAGLLIVIAGVSANDVLSDRKLMQKEEDARAAVSGTDSDDAASRARKGRSSVVQVPRLLTLSLLVLAATWLILQIPTDFWLRYIVAALVALGLFKRFFSRKRPVLALLNLRELERKKYEAMGADFGAMLAHLNAEIQRALRLEVRERLASFAQLPSADRIERIQKLREDVKQEIENWQLDGEEVLNLIEREVAEVLRTMATETLPLSVSQDRVPPSAGSGRQKAGSRKKE